MSGTNITNPEIQDIHALGEGESLPAHPVDKYFISPCNHACPVGENIEAWMMHAQAGAYFEAFQVLMQDCPFPAIMGRICARPCEKNCNRRDVDSAVNIHAVERFIGDEAIRNNWQPDFNPLPGGKKVLVVGAGPSGMSAAYHLTLLGHCVDMVDAGSLPGGLLRSGIPTYHLPKDILEAEIGRLVKMGINFRQNYTVQDIEAEKINGGYDAVYLSTGAQTIKQENFNYDDSVYLTDAFSFFREARLNDGVFIQKKVVIYGGGKLALYIARMIRRFESDATVFFEGDKKSMPAHDYETDNALAEGVNIQLLHCVRRIEKKEVTLEVMKSENERVVGTGAYITVPADIFINANQQQADTAYLSTIQNIDLQEDGTVITDDQQMTGVAGIFAGGDMLSGVVRSAAVAVGQGKKAARYINSYLRQEPYVKDEKYTLADYQKLRIVNHKVAFQQSAHTISAAEAVRNFDEVNAGLTENQTRLEANRCLKCASCLEGRA